MSPKITNYKLHIINWIKANRTEALMLGLILLVGAFFRLYKIADYMTFLGDEGRDALIVRRLLVDFDPILVGPGTSIGNMYLGPLYYYLMAPALLLAGLSPVGPAVMVALLGIFTIWLIWFVSREWFPHTFKGLPLQGINVAALIASFLYAISPIVIIYSKSSWNPNIMPFFALLTIHSIWQVYKKSGFKWLIVLGISFAFVLQSHYLGLLLVPTLGLFWILTVLKIGIKKSVIRNFAKYSIIGFVIFSLLMSPLVIFDARHNWINFSAIKTFFTQRETTVSIKPWKALSTIYPIFRDDFVTRIVAGSNKLAGNILSISILTYVLIVITTSLRISVVNIRKFEVGPILIVIAWIFFGLVGMGLYKQHIYDHYFGFMFPAVFLLIGALAQKIYYQYGDSGKIVTMSAIALLVVANLVASPLRYPPNGQMARASEVAKLIEGQSGGRRFNLAVIADRNYEDGYQYFLEKNRTQVVEIDSQIQGTTADQLFVVCELEVGPGEEDRVCDPTHNPKAQVANFGWSKVDGKWSVYGVTVYKLIHSDGK